jgi:hypothetical protein
VTHTVRGSVSSGVWLLVASSLMRLFEEVPVSPLVDRHSPGLLPACPLCPQLPGSEPLDVGRA